MLNSSIRVVQRIGRAAPPRRGARRMVAAAAAAGVLLMGVAGNPSALRAATVVKANNSNDLNLPASWIGGVVPGPLDIAQWNSTVTGANSTLLGADLSWLGLSVTNPGGAVTIGGGNTLTLGTSGINMNAATQDLFISSNLTLGPGGQGWNVATGRTLTISSGTFTRSAGATLQIDSTSNTGTIAANPALTNGLLPWGSISSAGSASNNGGGGLTYATVSSGNLVPYTTATPLVGTALQAASDSSLLAVNYDSSWNGTATMGNPRFANTMRFTSTGGTIGQNSAAQLTLNGIMNAGSGLMTIQVFVVAPANGELVINSGSQGFVFTKSPNVATNSLTVTGNSTVNFTGATSAAATFTGATTVAGGTLQLSGATNFNTSSGFSINGSNAKLLYTSSVVGTNSITLTRGTLDGTTTVGNVTVGAGTGGILTNGNGATTAIKTGNLTFQGAATVNANIGAATGTGIIVNGALTTTPAGGQVTINPSGTFAVGLNNLIAYTSFGGNLSDFTLGTVTGLSQRATRSLAFNGNAIALNVGSNEAIVWTGQDSNVWNTSATFSGPPQNFVQPSIQAKTAFVVSDAVQFNDTATVAGVNGGNPFTPTGAVSISGGNVSPSSTTFNNSSVSYTLSSSDGSGIATGSLTKNGSATTTLTTANTYAGGTTLNAGTLVLNNATALGTGAITINGGIIDSTSAAVMTAGNSQNWNADFSFAGSSDLDMGAGAVTIGGTGTDRTVTVSTGTLTVGEVRAATHNLIKQGAGTLVVTSTGTGGNASILTAGTLNVAAGTLQINRTTADTNNSGDFTATGGLTGAGTVTNGAAVERWFFVAPASGTQTFTGTLTNGSGGGALGFNKSGAGTQILSGNLSYTGATTVTAGTLAINTANSGAGTPVTLGGGNLVLGNTQALGASSLISVTANTSPTLTYATDGGDTAYQLSMGSGTTSLSVILDRATAGSSVTHPLSTPTTAGLGGGTVSFTRGSNVSGTATASFDRFNLGAGSVQTTFVTPNAGTVVSIGTVTKALNNPVQTLGLDGVSSGNEITGAISNGTSTAVGVTKSNASSWTLSGASSYTGPTTITGGTLRVTGSIASSLSTTVNGGTLEGTGTVSALTLNPGGKVSPGTSIGVLNSASMTWNSDDAQSGGLYELGIGNSTSDQLALSGTLTKGTGNTFLFDFAGGTPGITYSLVTFQSTTFSASDFGIAPASAALGYAGTFLVDADSVDFTPTSVPEPSALGLLAGAGLLLGRRRRLRG